MEAATGGGLTLVDNPATHRFEARRGDEVVGFVTYRRNSSRILLNHTEVDESVEGQGIGSRLAKAVFEELRGSPLQVRVTCPFLTGYLARHPEYADVVDRGSDGARDRSPSS